MISLRLSHSNGSVLDVANDTLESDDGILLGEIGDMDDWPKIVNIIENENIQSRITLHTEMDKRSNGFFTVMDERIFLP